MDAMEALAPWTQMDVSENLLLFLTRAVVPGKRELMLGDELDPNEIYFLSDGSGHLQKLVRSIPHES